MADKDDPEDKGERTVIGGPLPMPPAGLSPARPAPVPPKQENPDEVDAAQDKTVFGDLPTRDADEKTVIGGAVPPVKIPPATPHPESGQTVVGGVLPPTQPKPTAPQAPPSAPLPPPPGAVPPPKNDATRAPQPDPQSTQANLAPTPEVAQPAAPHVDGDATRVPSGHDPQANAAPISLANTANPFVAAAGNLLLLLGRLRTGSVRMPTPALYDHALQSISSFEQALEGSYADKHDILVAKYALCGTVDDIVQNLPDVDQAMWRNQPLIARFFSKRDSNVGFFQEAQKAIQSPSQRYHLLEFMLICLNLGFEGQYRGKAGGTADLASIRSAIFETLRRARPIHDRDLSVIWKPVALQSRSRLRAVPIWAVAGMALLAVVAFFGTLSNLLNRDGTAVAESLYALHPAQTQISLERAPGPVFEAPASQFERLSGGLAEDLSSGRVELIQQGDFIVIRLANARLFESGSAEANPAFEPLAARIATTLNTEAGPVFVVGYTDSQGAFNTNLQLSISRAEAVAALLRDSLSDPLRVVVEGRGEADPIADNSTEEGRAKNRRVDIKLAREGTF